MIGDGSRGEDDPIRVSNVRVTASVCRRERLCCAVGVVGPAGKGQARQQRVVEGKSIGGAESLQTGVGGSGRGKKDRSRTASRTKSGGENRFSNHHGCLFPKISLNRNHACYYCNIGMCCCCPLKLYIGLSRNSDQRFGEQNLDRYPEF